MNLPSKVDVVVIGGGVVGVTAALALAERRLSVALVEKGRVAAEQSSRNWGYVRAQGRDPAELPMMLDAMREWDRIAPQLDLDAGWRRTGATYLAETEAERAGFEAFMVHAREHQMDTRLMTAAETDAHLGRDDRRFAGAMHTPSDGMAEPGLAVPAMARLAARKGVAVLEGCAARVLDMAGGRVRGVVTERGRIACDAAILAGGAWSRSFLENHRVPLPQLGVRASVLRTVGGAAAARGPLSAARASIRPRGDGGVTIARAGAARFDLIPAAFVHLPAFATLLRRRWGILKLRAGAGFFGPLARAHWTGDDESPFEAIRVMNPAPDTALLASVLDAARDLHPALRGERVAATWGGVIDVMPDELPVIDRVAALPGLVVATGFSGHGFGLGPGAGRAAAALAADAGPGLDLSPFRLDRFSRRKAA